MKRTIKPIPQTKQWMFHYNNTFNGLPYVNKRDYTLIKQAILLNPKNVEKRVNDLTYRGFEVRRCYVPTYNGIGNFSYMPRLNEIRIIVGRPVNHFPREVFAVIIKAE